MIDKKRLKPPNTSMHVVNILYYILRGFYRIRLLAIRLCFTNNIKN